MTTLTIHIPEKKVSQVKKILRELDVEIATTDSEKIQKPNAETIKAKKDAKKGKITRIKNLKAFFDSI